MRAIHTLGLLVCLTLCGCLELEQKITLKPDGSGTQEISMAMQESLLQELKLQQAAVSLGTPGDPTAVFSEDKVRAELEAAGLELTAHEVERVQTRRSVALTASFGDFEGLRRSPLCGSAAEWELAPGPRPGLAKLTFYLQGKAAWQQARQKAAQMKGELDPVLASYFQKSVAKLRGLDVAFRFALPGDVQLWTRNMEKVSDREVVARVTSAQIKTPQDLVRRLAPRYVVVFDASGTTLLAPAATPAGDQPTPVR